MPNTLKVAIIDDEADMRDSISQWLSLSGFDVETYISGEEALKAIGADFPGLVITDIKMPGMDGITLLKRLISLDAALPVVMITGHGDVPLAVEAMRLGAYDFLEKPFNPEHMNDIAQKAIDARRITLEGRELRKELSYGGSLIKRLIGDCDSIVRLREDILDYGQVDGHVLIDGEVGTGKTLVAHALHAVGPRASKRFVTFSCASLSEELLQERLFGLGYEGAIPTLLEEARGGTLCLEDIECLPNTFQAQLLGFIDTQETPPETRIIAICNEHAPNKTLSDILRPDLMYRLGATALTCPPLRARGNDIITLYTTILNEFASDYGCAAPELSADGAAQLLQAPWPGNMRQLTSLAEKVVLQSRRGKVSLASLLMTEGDTPLSAMTTEGKPLKEHVESFERILIDTTMRRHKGNIGAVMEELRLPRRTLNEKMSKYGLQRQDYIAPPG